VFPNDGFLQAETLQSTWMQYKHGLQQILLNSLCSTCLYFLINSVDLKQK